MFDMQHNSSQSLIMIIKFNVVYHLNFSFSITISAFMVPTQLRLLCRPGGSSLHDPRLHDQAKTNKLASRTRTSLQFFFHVVITSLKSFVSRFWLALMYSEKV